jgi:hypothetical protein
MWREAMEDCLADARTALHAAHERFDAATDASLVACARQAALDIALVKGGIRAGDPVCAEIDQAVAHAALALWRCRAALQSAYAAVEAAERQTNGPAPLFDQQLALIRQGDPRLYDRYLRELDAVANALDDEERWAARQRLGQTKRLILAYQPAEVSA